jgi:hypothetical protein
MPINLQLLWSADPRWWEMWLQLNWPCSCATQVAYRHKRSLTQQNFLRAEDFFCTVYIPLMFAGWFGLRLKRG